MARFTIEWSVDARADLIDILQFYIDRNGSSTYSRKTNLTINKIVNKLRSNPLLGIRTDYESVRIINSGNFQIVYELLDHTVLIILIWDCRRNPEDRIIDNRVK
jgi:plasmid stabilization system protein ParE